jgi:hypothetical protein
MGSEAPCTLHHNDAILTGTAQLETTFISFRGPTRLKIPFTAISALSEYGGQLRIEHDGAVSIFALGPVAARWLNTIQNPKSVLAKLGIKPGQRVCLLSLPDPAFAAQVKWAGAVLCATPETSDAVFLGVEQPDGLAPLVALRNQIPSQGAVWVVYPKGGKAVTEAAVLLAGRAAGFTDVKVVAFSPTHTALRFVIPKALRSSRN